jgi:hypothetical protein
MTEGDEHPLAAEIRKVREKKQRPILTLRPWMREPANFEYVRQLVRRGDLWEDITEAVANLGVRDARGRVPKRQAVWEAYKAVELKRAGQTAAPHQQQPTAKPRPPHPSKILTDGKP